MDLTEHSDAVGACPDSSAAAGMIGGVIGAGFKVHILCADILHDGLDKPLEPEEARLGTVGSEGEHL